MSDRTILTLIIVSSVLAFGFGMWAGLGYPGLFEKHAKTGKAPRTSPFQMLMDWIFGKFIR